MCKLLSSEIYSGDMDGTYKLATRLPSTVVDEVIDMMNVGISNLEINSSPLDEGMACANAGA